MYYTVIYEIEFPLFYLFVLFRKMFLLQFLAHVGTEIYISDMLPKKGIYHKFSVIVRETRRNLLRANVS